MPSRLASQRVLGINLSHAVEAARSHAISPAHGNGYGSIYQLTRGDLAYVLVLVWAFAGIGVKHAATPSVATAAWIATALAAALLLVGPRRTPRLPMVRRPLRL